MGLDEMDEDYEDEEAECPTCGAIIPLDAAECPECGQFFEEEDEEELWDSEEELLEEDEEMEDEWEDLLEEEPSKGKLYLGIIVLLFGSVGLSFMSWFHNQLNLFEGVVDNYSPHYGYIDQMVGGSGAVVSIIGLILIYMWWKDNRQAEELTEDDDLFEDDDDLFEDDDEEYFEDDDLFEDDDEEYFEDEEEYPEDIPGMEEPEPMDEELRESQQIQ